MINTRKAIPFSALSCALLVAIAGCNGRKDGPENISSGIVIEQDDGVSLYEDMTRIVSSQPPRMMSGPGLAGTMGAARVKMLRAGTHEVLVSMPQLSDRQVPVCYSITTTPPEAGIEYRLCQREQSNVVVSIRLEGRAGDEIEINWSSIVLIANIKVTPDSTRPKDFLSATACVQSDADLGRKLADKLWPESGKYNDYALNIQKFIQKMKQQKQPRSLDALGILDSGANWICTANANLATALLRSKGIPARSIAVIPLTSQRLEMHRVVEFFDSGKWLKFDPSSLHKDIPLHPWQNIIMAETTLADEDIAMKPRMGASLGCPYGQELEFMGNGISFWGNDFFWTIGKTLAEFEASDEAIDLARHEWNRFMESGKLSQCQVNAASTDSAATFLKALNPCSTTRSQLKQ